MNLRKNRKATYNVVQASSSQREIIARRYNPVRHSLRYTSVRKSARRNLNQRNSRKYGQIRFKMEGPDMNKKAIANPTSSDEIIVTEEDDGASSSAVNKASFQRKGTARKSVRKRMRRALSRMFSTETVSDPQACSVESKQTSMSESIPAMDAGDKCLIDTVINEESRYNRRSKFSFKIGPMSYVPRTVHNFFSKRVNYDCTSEKGKILAASDSKMAKDNLSPIDNESFTSRPFKTQISSFSPSNQYLNLQEEWQCRGNTNCETNIYNSSTTELQRAFIHKYSNLDGKLMPSDKVNEDAIDGNEVEDILRSSPLINQNNVFDITDCGECDKRDLEGASDSTNGPFANAEESFPTISTPDDKRNEDSVIEPCTPSNYNEIDVYSSSQRHNECKRSCTVNQGSNTVRVANSLTSSPFTNRSILKRTRLYFSARFHTVSNKSGCKMSETSKLKGTINEPLTLDNVLNCSNKLTCCSLADQLPPTCGAQSIAGTDSDAGYWSTESSDYTVDEVDDHVANSECGEICSILRNPRENFCSTPRYNSQSRLRYELFSIENSLKTTFGPDETTEEIKNLFVNNHANDSASSVTPWEIHLEIQRNFLKSCPLQNAKKNEFTAVTDHNRLSVDCLPKIIGFVAKPNLITTNSRTDVLSGNDVQHAAGISSGNYKEHLIGIASVSHVEQAVGIASSNNVGLAVGNATGNHVDDAARIASGDIPA